MTAHVTPATSRAGRTRNELRGTPASGGLAVGAARVIRSLEDGAALRRGEILICAAVTPAWAPVFAIAGGVVTETGGVLSSAAVVAREYGIPVVAGVRGATARIADGQRIQMDGTAGVVSPQG